MAHNYQYYFPHIDYIVRQTLPNEPVSVVIGCISRTLQLTCDYPEAWPKIYYWLVHGEPARNNQFVPLETWKATVQTGRTPSLEETYDIPCPHLVQLYYNQHRPFTPQNSHIMQHQVNNRPSPPIIRAFDRMPRSLQLPRPLEIPPYPGPMNGPPISDMVHARPTGSRRIDPIIPEGPAHISIPDISHPQPMLPTQTVSKLEALTNRTGELIVAPGAVPPALPPSVEEAYKKKCIELKRRMNEVDASNDEFRLRKVRLTRGIRKMRLERAFLLEILSKRMKKAGSGIAGLNEAYDEDSDGSSEGPPTVKLRHSSYDAPAGLISLLQPQEKPLRSKRGHRRPIPSPPTLTLPLSASSSLPPSATFSAPIAPQPGSFSTLPRMNGGTPITPLLPHPPIPQYNPSSHLHPSTSLPLNQPSLGRSPPVHPLPPSEDFQRDFLHHNVLPNRDRHPVSDAELEAYARSAWNKISAEEKEMWKDRYEEKMQVYQEEVDAYNRAKRAMKRAEGGRGHHRGAVAAGEVVTKEEDAGMGMSMEGVEGEDEGKREGEDENDNGGVEGGFTAVNG